MPGGILDDYLGYRPAAPVPGLLEPDRVPLSIDQAPSDTGSVALQYLRDVLSGKIAANALPNTYDPSRSFSANVRNPQGLQQAMDVAMGVSGPGLAIKAYHGSPHDFERFDMSKIGTGEGAQAYGHGLYFAEHPEVAEGYRQTLSRRNINATWDGQPIEQWGKLVDSLNDQDWRVAKMVDDYGRVGGDLPAFVQRQKDWYRDQPPMMAALDEFTKRIDSKFTPGRMYEAQINAEPEQFLDWDQFVGRQNPRVQQFMAARDIPERLLGSGAYQQLAADLGGVHQRVTSVGGYDLPYNDPAKASQSLREAGIPGIRYLDQGSRGAGEGTHNYVMFDDKLIEILREYGIVPPLAGGAAGGGMLGFGAEPPT